MGSEFDHQRFYRSSDIALRWALWGWYKSNVEEPHCQNKGHNECSAWLWHGGNEEE